MLKIKFRKVSGEKVLGFNIASDGLFIFLVWWEGAILWQNAPNTTCTGIAVGSDKPALAASDNKSVADAGSPAFR